MYLDILVYKVLKPYATENKRKSMALDHNVRGHIDPPGQWYLPSDIPLDIAFNFAFGKVNYNFFHKTSLHFRLQQEIY